MARNYEKEAAWEKEKYHQLKIKCPIDVWERLTGKLQKDGKTVTEIVLDAIKKYISETNK